MSKYEDATSGFLGFVNVQDFFESFLGVKSWTVNAVVAAIGAVTSFIGGYMWNDPSAIWVLWILMGSDWLTGIAKSIVNKKFISYKLWRMPLYYIATSFVIAISWWISKSNIIFKPLPSIVICGFYSVYFISLLENLGEIGVLPKPIVALLKKKFGLKKLLDKDQ